MNGDDVVMATVEDNAELSGIDFMNSMPVKSEGGGICDMNNEGPKYWPIRRSVSNNRAVKPSRHEKVSDKDIFQKYRHIRREPVLDDRVHELQIARNSMIEINFKKESFRPTK